MTGNSRLSEIEAAALRIELRRLPEWNGRRQLIARALPGGGAGDAWQAPHERHVYHLCVARIDDRDVPAADAVRDRRALPAGAHPTARVPAVRAGPCPEAESWAAECVSLPCFPEMTDDEIEIVCRALR